MVIASARCRVCKRLWRKSQLIREESDVRGARSLEVKRACRDRDERT